VATQPTNTKVTKITKNCFLKKETSSR
jgi:hypothetical protein